MENIGEWLNLVVRLFHIVAGIGWIGSSFYFMWLDSALEKSLDPKIQGTLWMVHSGGFYRVERRVLGPGEVPPNLHWFKWEALFTGISGIFLLGVVYYWGGLMAETGINPGVYISIGIGIIAITWIFYDRLWLSSIPQNVSTLISLTGLSLLTLLSTKYLGGRSSFIHVGAALGTIMVANVWLRILPVQRQLIELTKNGESLDLGLAKRAKLRSIHNNYLTFPVLFIMISNHFPSTYGHAQNWLVLLLFILGSFVVRHYLNTRRHAWLLAVSVSILIFLVWFTQ